MRSIRNVVTAAGLAIGVIGVLPSCKSRGSDPVTSDPVSLNSASLPVVPDKDAPIAIKDFASHKVSREKPYLASYVERKILDRFKIFELPELGFVVRNGKLDFLNENTMLKTGDLLVISPTAKFLADIPAKDLANLTGDIRFDGYREQLYQYHFSALQTYSLDNARAGIERTENMAKIADAIIKERFEGFKDYKVRKGQSVSKIAEGILQPLGWYNKASDSDRTSAVNLLTKVIASSNSLEFINEQSVYPAPVIHEGQKLKIPAKLSFASVAEMSDVLTRDVLSGMNGSANRQQPVD